MTLTPLEQKVYHALYEQEVFRSRDVELVLKNYWTSAAIIKRLHKFAEILIFRNRKSSFHQTKKVGFAIGN